MGGSPGTVSGLYDVCSTTFQKPSGSLVLRPYARAREQIWLHKSKFLGSLHNLKATNEIVYWNNEVASQAPSRYYGLVCAVCFQDLLQQLQVRLIYTYCTSSHCRAIYFGKQDSQSHRRTSKHDGRACRSSTLYAVSTSNLSNF